MSTQEIEKQDRGESPAVNEKKIRIPGQEKIMRLISRVRSAIAKQLNRSWFRKKPTAQAAPSTARDDAREKLENLLANLESRFAKNRNLHPKLTWSEVVKVLQTHPEVLGSLQKLEETGGEPDVIGEDETGIMFGDCSRESPDGRRDMVFDAAAEKDLQEKSQNEGYNGNAADRVAEWGVKFMNVEQYTTLQKQIPIDVTTRSLLETPAENRKLGLALTGSRRGDETSILSLDAHTHRKDMGFRCVLKVNKAA